MTEQNKDEYWMRRCFQLAKKGAGFTSPNPLVGAVIVQDGKKIAEGYHKRYGEAHAEVNAIQSALKKTSSLKGATMYVNLEPCYHYGNTPPCVDAIIKHKFRRVVISSIDPFPLVQGNSVKKLRANGIECTTGILQDRSEQLNEKFFHFVTKNTPFIAVKAAQTLDGFIAKRNGESKWISNVASRNYVHQIRSEYDAVLVGANTVLKDDPLLTVRNSKGRNPIRIVLDGMLSTSPRNKIYNSDASTILYSSKAAVEKNKKKIQEFDKQNVAVVSFPAKKGKINLHLVVKDLAQHKITSLLVEGGQRIYSEFLNTRLVDKLYLFTAQKSFGTGISTFGDVKVEFEAKRKNILRFDSDVCEEYVIEYLPW